MLKNEFYKTTKNESYTFFLIAAFASASRMTMRVTGSLILKTFAP